MTDKPYDVEMDTERMPLPTQAKLTQSDREFIIGRSLLVIVAVNVIWAVVYIATVWALR